MGRVDHFLMGEQSGADPERVKLTRICIVTEDLWKQKEEQMSFYKAAVQVEMAKKFGCKHVFVEMNPGDALFFHSNLLHTRCLNVNRDSSYRRLEFKIFQRSEQERSAAVGDDLQLQPGYKMSLSIPKIYRYHFLRLGIVLSLPIIAPSTPPFIKWQTMRWDILLHNKVIEF